MSIFNSSGARVLVVCATVPGCLMRDKAGLSTNFESCFHQDGPGLPNNWMFDATHWACEQNPISRDFEINVSSFPWAIAETEASWDDAQVPWNSAGAHLAFTRDPSWPTISDTADDGHNAVFYWNGHHPSQIGWLGATVCYPHSVGSPEAKDCDVRIFGEFLWQADNPNTPNNEESTSAISWTTSLTAEAGDSYHLSRVFAHEMHHVVGFSHNNNIGSITEETVDVNALAPETFVTQDVNALLWVYGQ